VRKHYILWQFKEETTREQIATAFAHVATLRDTVPGLLHVRNGENVAARRGGGYTHFSEMFFESESAHAAYNKDPSHVEVANTYTIPIAKRAITLDFDES
jgi:heme-degrading monooxygenase HmoA